MTNRIPRVDTDADDQVENANVDALVNFAASDTLSAYPLSIGTDTDHAASDHEDGGSLELDAANLAGGLGSADQVLITDGAANSWALVDTANLAAEAVTTAEVDGSGGSSGQVLETDGTAGGVTWQDNERWTTTTVTSNTTASDNDEVLADSSGGALTVTLPTPANGVRVRCMRIASGNGVTLARSGTENINGSASDLSLSYLESVEVVSDGTDWWIV